MGLAGGRRGRSALGRPAASHPAGGPPAPGPGKGRGRLGRPWRRWGALALALAAAGWVLLVAATATSRYLNQSTVLRQRASLPAMPPIAVPADGQRDEPGEPGPTGVGSARARRAADCGGEGGPACPPFAATDADDLLSTPDCGAQLGLFRARFDELRAAGCPAAVRRRAVADATEAALYSALWDQHPPFDPAAAAAQLDLWDGLGDEEKAAGEAKELGPGGGGGALPRGHRGGADDRWPWVRPPRGWTGPRWCWCPPAWSGSCPTTRRWPGLPSTRPAAPSPRRPSGACSRRTWPRRSGGTCG